LGLSKTLHYLTRRLLTPTPTEKLFQQTLFRLLLIGETSGVQEKDYFFALLVVDGKTLASQLSKHFFFSLDSPHETPFKANSMNFGSIAISEK